MLNEAFISAAYEQCPSTVHSRALHWNIGNAGSWAHLRVQYDDVGFARMMDRLKTNRDVDFTMEDQMELIGDELALLKSVFLICLADKLALGSEMKRAFQRYSFESYERRFPHETRSYKTSKFHG